MRWRDRFLFVAEALYKAQAETGEVKGHYLWHMPALVDIFGDDACFGCRPIWNRPFLFNVGWCQSAFRFRSSALVYSLAVSKRCSLLPWVQPLWARRSKF